VSALHLETLEFLVVFASVAVGAIVQGSIGFGLNLVVVPVVAILEPAALPASMIMMAIPMTLGSAIREHDHIDYPGVWWTTLGRLPGVVVGAWVVSALTPGTLSLVIGGLVVLAAAMTAVSPPVRVVPLSEAAAGFVAGAMGTASSIGGPPIALLYQREPGAIVRSTLGATFLIGLVLSLAALAFAGQVESWHVLLAIALMPAIGIGLLVSAWLHPFIDAGWLRPLVLTFAGLSGGAVMLWALVGGPAG